MASKRKKHNSKQTEQDKDVGLFISMLLGFMGYIVNIRPKIGEYGSGVMDCLLVISVLIFVLVKINKRIKR